MFSDWTEALKLQNAGLSGAQGRPRHGLVTATDPSNHAVRIALQPEGIVTGWIPDPGLACAGLRICCPCEVGTQVLAVPVEGDAEHPVIIARLFDATIVPPTSPATNKPVQPGEIGIFLADGTFFHVSNQMVSMKGTLHVDGAITVTGDITAAGISLLRHVHGGVQAGSDLTTASQG